MQCTNPANYDRYGLYIKSRYPCGSCLACRINLRHEWASRLILESRQWHNSIFFTLTYADEHLPDDGKLSRQDIVNFTQNWTRQQGHEPRYFIAGEYGSLNGRPHYHGIFFGQDLQLTPESTGIHYQDLRFHAAWQKKGFIDVKDFGSTKHSTNIMTYVAGYVLKGAYNDTSENLEKEWMKASRQPPIGFGAAEKIVSVLTTRVGAMALSRLGSAPTKFSYGGRSWIMPYRIRKMICEQLDIEFHPLAETGIIDLDTGELIDEIPEKLPIDEAKARENKIRSRLVEKSHKHLTEI